MLRSKTGRLLAALYAVAAVALFHEAMTCGVMLCDLVAIYVFLPLGYLVWLPWSGQMNYVANPMVRWEFVIPAVLGNLLFYYFIGATCACLWRKVCARLRRKA